MPIGSKESQYVSDKQRKAAYAHISARLPWFGPLVARTGALPLPTKHNRPVAESLVHIVASQMLSRAAAETILIRMQAIATRGERIALHELSADQLRICGLSARKARTVTNISDAVQNDPDCFERWRELTFDELLGEVRSFWGLSDWSAGILAIFHFQMPDVFPSNDGSLLRAVKQMPPEVTAQFPFLEASPYRSYVAITLWAALDAGMLRKVDATPPPSARPQ